MIEAVVPVRAGSRRLKGKNTSKFAGSNLLTHKIRQLQRCKEVDSVLVSSDSEAMLELAEREGARLHFRSPEYADDVFGRSLSETISHIVSQSVADHILWAQVTSPLVDEAVYGKAVNLYLRAREDGFDSLVTQTTVNEFLWSSEGPINYSAGADHIPSQNLTGITKMTFGILLAPRLEMLSWAYYHGPNPYRMLLGKRESVDIDDLLDLEAARAWLDLSSETSTEVLPFDASSNSEA